MDLGKAFTFVFDDDQWLVTLLIGGLLLMIPILGWLLLLGFALETARNVMRGSAQPLPRWDNFADKLMLGFYSFLIQLVYALPAVLLAFLFVCVIMGLVLGMRTEEPPGAAIALAGICFVPLVSIVSIIVQPITWAAHGRFLQSGSLGEALRISEIIAMTRASLGSWVIVWLLNILCGMIGGAGSIVLFVGLLFSFPYSQAVFGHILGQASMPPAQQYNYPPAAYNPPPTYQ